MYCSCQPGSRASERWGRGECLWYSLVFVLKSSFARRQNINVVSLFLLVLARDSVPAEVRLILIRGGPVCRGFSRPPSLRARRGSEKGKRFPFLPPAAALSYVYAPSRSLTRLCSLEFVVALTVLPFLFYRCCRSSSPSQPPILSSLFFTEADTVQRQSTVGCIKHHCCLPISPKTAEQPLISSPLSSSLLRACPLQAQEDSIPHIKKKRGAEEKVIS